MDDPPTIACHHRSIRIRSRCPGKDRTGNRGKTWTYLENVDEHVEQTNIGKTEEPYHNRGITLLRVIPTVAFYLIFFLAFYLTFFLAFYLTFFQAFYLTSIMTYFLAFYCEVLSGILSGIHSANAASAASEEEKDKGGQRGGIRRSDAPLLNLETLTWQVGKNM